MKRTILKTRLAVVVLALGCGSVHAQAQGPLPKCAVAEMIVTGTIAEYDAKHQGVSLQAQLQTMQARAEKLAETYGGKVGTTYSHVQTNLLHSLYEGPEYTSMSPQEFRASMERAFYHDPSCPQST